MTPHTPPTQAELDGWRDKILLSSAVNRLITEVERLRVELTMNQGVWQIDRDHEMRGAQSECACPSCNLHRHIARLTKEVEELRKDKERLDWIEINQKSICHDCEAVHDAWCVSLRGERFNTIRAAIDSAMQQKGEE